MLKITINDARGTIEVTFPHDLSPEDAARQAKAFLAAYSSEPQGAAR